MKFSLILLFTFFSFAIAVAQAPTDCSEDPFAAGCIGTNQGVSQTAILCGDGTIFHADGSGYDKDGVQIANTGKGTNFTSATSMNRACDSNGGVVAYVDDEVLQTSAVVTTAQGGLNSQIGTNSQNSGNINVNISNLGSDTTIVNPVNIGNEILGNLPDWSDDSGLIWLPEGTTVGSGGGINSTGTTSSGTTSSGGYDSNYFFPPNYIAPQCCDCFQCYDPCPVSNPTPGEPVCGGR